MERRQTGRATDTNRTHSASLGALGCALVAALCFVQHDALAANLVDVRVGEHRGYTRVVLELDSLAAYQVSEPREGEDAVMRVELDARGGARQLNVSDQLVSGVRIEPQGKSTAIHVDLSKAAVQINEMILLSPPRLVFDIRDPSVVVSKRSQTEATPERALPVAKIEPEPDPEPVVAKAESGSSPAPHPAIVPAPQADPKTPEAAEGVAAEPAPVADASTSPNGAPAADSQEAAADENAAPAHLAIRDAQATADTPGGPVPTPGGPLPVGAATAGRPNSLTPPGGMAPGTPGRPMADAQAPNKPLAVPPLPSQRGGADASAAAGEPGMVGSVIAMVTGLNWMVLAGAGLVVLLLVVFLMRRGRGAEDDLSPVMAAEDLGGDGDDLFGQPETGMGADESMGMEATEPIPTERSASSAPPPPPAGAADATNLEGRVAQLEGALAQLTQSRENMERQLAAQTEELRVQRAAIARTQRVVRSIGDGGEEEPGATEPVPRAPSS